MKTSGTPSEPQRFAPIPADDPRRDVTIAQPDGPALTHLSVVGDTYTILVTGQDTGGRYTMIDMHIPPDGGPPPHRHDFEEMFTLLEGELEVTFRGTPYLARAGETINVPANAPHQFRNVSGQPARLLCLCAPSGQEEFFTAVGDRVASRTAPPPDLGAAARAGRLAKARELAPRYRTELLTP